MKLRNRKTGEIDDVSIIHSSNKIKGVVEHEDGVQCLFAYTLEEFNQEWEDYEEPKYGYFINAVGDVDVNSYADDKTRDSFAIRLKQIGNYFETEEEAEKAAEKLKVWKRLKDKGFRFDGWTIDDGLKISICTNFEGDNIYSESEKEIRTNLDLLFGGEE